MSGRGIRFALIGTSGHAERLARVALAGASEAELLGAAGSSPERGAEFARRYRLAKGYGSLAEVLADPDVEAVWIATPNHMHASMVVAAAEAGKHILAEKPLATSGAEAAEAVAAARANNVTLRVGYQHRFRPAHARLREMIRADEVGEIGLLRIHRYWRYPYYEGMDPSGPPAWRRSRQESGGWVINDIGSHLVDLMLWLSGAKAEVAGACLATQRFAVETEDSAALLLSLGGKGIGMIDTSAALASPGSRIEVYGAGGWIRGDDTLTGEGVIVTHRGEEQRFAPIDSLETYLAEVVDFARAIAGGPSIGADGEVAAENVRILEQARARGVRLA